MTKKITLILVLLLVLTGCGSPKLDSVYDDMDAIFESYEAGFSSTITIGTDTYFLEQDAFGNKHIIENTSDNNVELYYIDEQYYICKAETCAALTKENLETFYQDTYSISILQKVIDSALDYHISEYEYIKSTKNKDNEYDIAEDSEGVKTLVYPTTKKDERQIIIVDPNNYTLTYDYNTKEEEQAELVLKPELIITLENEVKDE